MEMDLFVMVDLKNKFYIKGFNFFTLQQILTSVRLELSIVIQMQSVIILMVATSASVILDFLEME